MTKHSLQRELDELIYEAFTAGQQHPCVQDYTKMKVSPVEDAENRLESIINELNETGYQNKDWKQIKEEMK